MDNNELLDTISQNEFHLVPFEEPEDKKSLLGLSLTDIGGYGTTLTNLAGTLSNALNGSQGLYKVTLPKGTHLASFKNESANLGAALSNKNNQLVGQARLNQYAFDPTSLATAGAMIAIYAKLGQIEAAQKEMMDFIEKKEKSELRGDLMFLADTYNAIKHNLNDEKYKSMAHIKAADIRQASCKQIEFYKSLIKDKTKEGSLLLSDLQIDGLLSDLKDHFFEYNLSLYLYSFSTCIEVLMQGNFNKEYLDEIADRINKYSIEYREIYTKTYNYIETSTNKSIETIALKGVKNISKGLGSLAEKIPLIKDTEVNKPLNEFGDYINTIEVKKNMDIVGKLIDKQETSVKPFVTIIDNINYLHNEEPEFLVDSENIYLLNNKLA